MTIPAIKILKQQKSRIDPSFCFKFSCNNRVTFTEITAKKFVAVQRLIMASEKKFSFKARLHSFKYAFRGVFLLFHYEHNAWIHLIAIVCAVMAGIILSLTSLEWVVILFAIGSVLAAEAINTAIEKLADFISPSHQVLIGKAKDLAAAVLILSTCAFIIGGIIFIPKIIHF